MSLSHDRFIFDTSVTTDKNKINDYVRLIDPLFDLRKLSSFFGTKAYYNGDTWYGVSLPDGATETLRTGRGDAACQAAVDGGLLIRRTGYTVPVSKVEALARARGISITGLKGDVIADVDLNISPELHLLSHTPYMFWKHTRPLAVYDLCWWFRTLTGQDITEDEMIAVMDRPVVRCKLNWEMGTGRGWSDLRLLNKSDLTWMTGYYPDAPAHIWAWISSIDTKMPPPPGEPYGYGYADITQVVSKRDEIIGGKPTSVAVVFTDSDTHKTAQGGE